MKKITTKEFNEILAKVNCENTKEHILCIISNYYEYMSGKTKEDGYANISDLYHKESIIISDFLDSKGYFD